MGWLTDGLLSVIFPQTCPCCGEVMVRGERLMCLKCRTSLPVTDHHLNPAYNELRSKLNGLVPIEKAAAYFHYNRLSAHAQLIHDAKYRGRPRIARQLAAEYSRMLLPTGFFNGIDAITPVPLNFWKECRRGYNQSAHIAMGIADVCHLPVLATLKARRHGSQTRKSGFERRADTKKIFTAIGGSTAATGHILLVDDICTTGSTLYACAEALHRSAPSMRISVMVLASAQLL